MKIRYSFILIFLFLLLIIPFKVSALTYSPLNVIWNGNYNQTLPFFYEVRSGSSSVQIGLTTTASGRENKFLKVTACTTDIEPTNSYSISNSSNSGALKSGPVPYIYTNIPCSVVTPYSGIVYTGKYILFYFEIDNWYLPDGQDRYQADSWFNMYNATVGYTNATYFLTFEMTPDNLYFNDYGSLGTSAGDQTIINQNAQILDQQYQTNQKLDGINDTFTNGFNSLTGKQDETNKKLDDIEDLQPDNPDKPDSGSYDDYSESEKHLLDSVKDVNFEGMSIGIDTKSSTFVWDSISSFINTHRLVFGMFIAILSLGIIKLAFGR